MEEQQPQGVGYNAPNVPYREFDWSKPRKTYVEATDPNAYSGLIDSYRDSYLGAVGSFLETQMAGGRAPAGWDPLDHIPEGYDDYLSAFAEVRSPEQLAEVKRQIDERIALRIRRERRGFGSTFTSDLVAGIFDPTNLIAGPALKGAGLLAGTAKGSLFVGGLGATQEAVVWAYDPAVLPEEGKLRVLGGGLGGLGLGAVMGAVVGGVTGRAAANAAPAPARQMSRGQIIGFVLNDLEGGNKIVNNKDGAGKTKWGITTKNNPEIADVGALTYDQAASHAQKKYWLPEFDKVDPRIAAVAFDAHYINSADTARAILKAGSVEEALRIYRNKLMWIAGNVEGKAKFRKAWNNRVDRLQKFVGGGNVDSPLIAGARQPGGIELNDRGYLKFRMGHTNMYDEAGNYIPAAYVKRKREPVDDFTLVDTPERPGHYETQARQAEQAGAKRSVEVMAPSDGTKAEGIVNRPRTRAHPPEEEPTPRTVVDDVDAAIELDRLERGDALAARRTAGMATPKEPEEGVEPLPFSLEKAAKQLPAEDVDFLRNVLEAKGLVEMNQPELNQLYKIVAKLPDINPEAAKMWMGKEYQGGKVTVGQVKQRIDALVLRRHQLKEMAPNYQRDAAPFDMDRVRDQLDLAMDEAVFHMERATDELERVRLERNGHIQNEINDVPPGIPGRREVIASIKRTWNAEYENAISLAKERRYRIRDRIQQIREERARHFGRAAELEEKEGEVRLMWEDQPGQFGEPPEDLKQIWAKDKEMQQIAAFSVKELKASIVDIEDQMFEMEANAERWVGREKKVLFSKGQQKRYQQLVRQQHFFQNRLHQVEAFNKELDDYLPFRLPEGGRPTPEHLEDPDGDYIAVDAEALLASFPQKPWTQSVHGLPGLAEDAFETPEEWVNFVVLHETEHVQNPRMDGESRAAYEQRINDRAMAQLRGGAAPWKPIDGWKERLVLAPTPIGQLMRLVENPLNYMWKSIATLAGDYDLRLQRNLVEGGSSQAGGSVFQRTMRHTAKAADFINKEGKLYLRYMTGKESDFGAATTAFGVWKESRKAAGRGRMSWEEFDRAVGKAQATGKPHPVKEVNDAAKMFNDIVVDMRRQEEELGLLPGKAQIEAELNATRSAIASLESLEGIGIKGSAILQRLRDKLPELEAKAAHVTPVPGKKGLPYFTRVWNPAAMMKNPDEIKRIFREGFQRDGASVQDAAAAAENLYNKLIEDPTGQSIEVSAMAGELRSRQIPVENDEVIDFIHTDAHIILARYTRHTGGSIEMTRAYGDPAGDLEADRVYAALEADGLKEGDIQAAMQIWYDARDRVIGGFHGENPMSTSNRLVRFAKRWTRFATMGMSGISQLTDLVRSLWVTGPQNFTKGMFSPLFMQMDGMDPGSYAAAAGEGLEIELGLMARRMMDDDDWTMRATETGIERMMGDLEVPFFILNGVTPFTNMLKRAVARATPHMVIDRARKVTAAIHAGEAVPAEDATWLREYGIDEHDAQLLASLPVQESPGGFIMADFKEWEALGEQGLRGKDLLLGVISGHTRRAVATPGPLNRPRIMDGIMISKKERQQAYADRWAAEQAETDARNLVDRMYQEGFRHGDPDYEDAIAGMVEAAGAHKRARLNVGSKARKERPLASLPFQLQSFAFSQSSKLLHSMLSGRDKGVLVGVLSLWAGGIVVSWLKGEIAGTNDNATLDEHIMRGFNNSGLMSWLSIPVQAAQGLARIQLGEVNLGPVNIVEKDQPGLADQMGALGPAFGLGVGSLEAMFGKGFDGSDLAPSERVYQLRKALPFGNLLYWNWLVRIATDAMMPDDLTPKRADQPMPSDEYSRTVEGLMGFQVGDVDPRAPIPEVRVQDAVSTKALDIDAFMAQLQVEHGKELKKKKQRQPRVGDVPVWERGF